MRSLFYPVMILTLTTLAMLSEACRTDKPPVISIICLGDGFGGSDCSLSAAGTVPEGCSVKDPSQPLQVYCPPSALKDFWMTTQADEANFSSWCYKVPAKVGAAELERIKGGLVAAREERDRATVVWQQPEVPPDVQP